MANDAKGGTGTGKGKDDFVIIIGGGRVGTEVASQFRDSLILEYDPVRVHTLREAIEPTRVMLGSGSVEDHLLAAGIERAAAVIVTTSFDGINLKCVYVARSLGAKRILSRVNELSNVPKFEEMGVDIFNAPSGRVSTVVENILHPERRAVCEFVLSDRSPAIGMVMTSMELPNEASIMSILREDKLLVPDGNHSYEVGDIVIVACPVEMMSRIGMTLSGTREAINPLDRVYVPFTGKDIIRRSFEEGFAIARQAKAELVLVYPKSTKGVMRTISEMQQMAQLAGVDIRLLATEGPDVMTGLASFIQKEETQRIRDGMKKDAPVSDETRMQILCIEPPKASIWKEMLETDDLSILMSNMNHPVVIARQYRSYSTVLLLVDDTEMSAQALSYASVLLMIFGSRVMVLTSLSEDFPSKFTKRIKERLRYLQRQARQFGTEVEIKRIEGNPTVEFIMEVKSGKYDLVLLNWNCRTIKRDIVKKIIGYGPRSVMLIP